MKELTHWTDTIILELKDSLDTSKNLAMYLLKVSTLLRILEKSSLDEEHLKVTIIKLEELYNHVKNNHSRNYSRFNLHFSSDNKDLVSQIGITFKVCLDKLEKRESVVVRQ